MFHIPSKTYEDKSVTPLIVYNLDETLNKESLSKFFSELGTPSWVDIPADMSSGRSRGFGLVYCFSEDAKIAIKLAQYKKLGKKHIEIMYEKHRRDPLAATLLVKNLDPSITVMELHTLFNDIAPVILTHIATDSEGVNLDHGFVKFEKAEDAEKTFKALSSHQIKGKEIKLVMFDQNETTGDTGDTGEESKLFFRNLHMDVSENDLQVAFSIFGQITSIVCKNWTSRRTQNKVRMGFINFKNVEDARRVSIEAPSHHEIARLFLGGKVYLGILKPKDKRKENQQQLQIQSHLSNLAEGEVVQELRRLEQYKNLIKEKQRRILGDFLFPQIEGMVGPELAPMITGLLIDLSILTLDEIIEFIESSQVLEERVEEVLDLLINDPEDLDTDDSSLSSSKSKPDFQKKYQSR